jgi:hypothetical protein
MKSKSELRYDSITFMAAPKVRPLWGINEDFVFAGGERNGKA